MGLVRLRLCGIPKECDSREEEVRTCACFLGVGVGLALLSRFVSTLGDFVSLLRRKRDDHV